MKKTNIIIAAAAAFIIGGAFSVSAHDGHEEGITIRIGDLSLTIGDTDRDHGIDHRYCRCDYGRDLDYRHDNYRTFCPESSHHHVEKGCFIPDPVRKVKKSSPRREISEVRTVVVKETYRKSAPAPKNDKRSRRG